MPYQAREQLQAEPDQPDASETDDEQRTRRTLLWGAVASLGLLILFIGLFSRQPEAGWGGTGVRLMARLPEPLVYSVSGFFVLVGVIVLTALVWRGLRFRRRKDPDGIQLYREPPKFSPGMLIALLAMVLMVIGLVVLFHWAAGKPLFPGARRVPLKAPLAAVTPPPRQAYKQKPAAEVPGIGWIFLGIATAAGAAIVVGGLWVLFGEQLRRLRSVIPSGSEDRRALVAAVEVSLEDLVREPDARRAVILCYHRLGQVLSLHGLPRASWQTPQEYLRDALRRFHVSAAPLRVLTVLFELAKFSGHPVGESDKRTAVAALREVKAVLEENHAPSA
jgi:hypothetical protein